MRSLCFVLAVVAGCTSDVDLTGVYQVTSDVESSPCGADAPVAMPPPYVRWSQDSFLGTDFWGYAECTDAAGMVCNGGPSLFGNPLSEPTDDGWRGEVIQASNGGDSNCVLGYTLGVATLTGTKLVYEQTEYSGMITTPPDKCTTDAAKQMKDSLACMAHQRMEATHL